MARYVPQGYAPYQVANAAAGVEVFTMACAPYVYAIAYQGKSVKSAFQYRFPTMERLAEYVNKWNAGLVAAANRKVAEREAAKAARKQAPVKVGSVFRASWGYDQTNIDYYEVVEVGAASVVVREIAQERIETLSMQGKCVPVKGKYIGEPMRKRINVYGESVSFRVTSYASAYLEKPMVVAGIEVGYASSHWTAYA